MKVFMNKRQGAYTGGLLLVAANSAEEAHELCLKSEELKYIYWDENWDEDCGCTLDEAFYPHGGWQEVPNLWYAGVNPCIIAEDGYTE